MANPRVLVTLNPSLEKKVLAKANSLGLSLAGYIRSLVIEDVKNYVESSKEKDKKREFK